MYHTQQWVKVGNPISSSRAYRDPVPAPWCSNTDRSWHMSTTVSELGMLQLSGWGYAAEAWDAAESSITTTRWLDWIEKEYQCSCTVHIRVSDTVPGAYVIKGCATAPFPCLLTAPTCYCSLQGRLERWCVNSIWCKVLNFKKGGRDENTRRLPYYGKIVVKKE